MTFSCQSCPEQMDRFDAAFESGLTSFCSACRFPPAQPLPGRGSVRHAPVRARYAGTLPGAPFQREPNQELIRAVFPKICFVVIVESSGSDVGSSRVRNTVLLKTCGRLGPQMEKRILPLTSGKVFFWQSSACRASQLGNNTRYFGY